jgi:hypothetical protein
MKISLSGLRVKTKTSSCRAAWAKLAVITTRLDRPRFFFSVDRPNSLIPGTLRKGQRNTDCPSSGARRAFCPADERYRHSVEPARSHRDVRWDSSGKRYNTPADRGERFIDRLAIRTASAECAAAQRCESVVSETGQCEFGGRRSE